MARDIDREAIEFAKEHRGELVGRRTGVGREFQVGRITNVDEEEGQIGFKTTKRYASGEYEDEGNLRAFSDRGLFELRPDIRAVADPGTFAIDEDDRLREATTGAMHGGDLRDPVFDLSRTRRAEQVHESRSKRARVADEAKAAETTTDFETWAMHPAQHDWPGVDTP